MQSKAGIAVAAFVCDAESRNEVRTVKEGVYVIK